MLIHTSSPFFCNAGDLKSGVILHRTSLHGAYVEITSVPGDLIVSLSDKKNKMRIEQKREYFN